MPDSPSNQTKKANGVTVVLVEDDLGQTVLIQKNLRRCGFDSHILTFDNAWNAWNFLLETHSVPGIPQTPYLVLLDLNLPGLDGLQLLKKIRSDPHTQHLFVAMLTTAHDSRDVERSYELGCNMYLTKPVEYEQLSDVIRDLGLLLTVVKLPEAPVIETKKE